MPIPRVLTVVAAVALGLGGCGVRGDLEPPPGAEAAAAPAGQPEAVAAEAPTTAGPDMIIADEDDERTERVIQSQRRTRHPPMSDSFVLDPLL